MNKRQLKDWRTYYLEQAATATDGNLPSLYRMYMKRVDAVDSLIAYYPAGAETWMEEDFIRVAVRCSK